MVKNTLAGIVFGSVALAASGGYAATLEADLAAFQWGYYVVPDAYSDGDALAGAAPITATFGDGSVSKFYAFDMDLPTAFVQGSSYSVTGSPFAGASLTGKQLTDINTLFELAMPGTDDFDAIERTAGIGLALWEILYETSGSYSLDGGDFWAALYDDTVPEEGLGLSFGNSLLAQIEAGVTPATNKYRLTFWESDGHVSNNMVSVSAVPLPATGLMLLGAGAALAGMRRRRNKSTT